MKRLLKRAAFVAAASFVASGVQALTVEECDRTTHISHGGETAHVDLGEGRVMWRDWWSQEGTATDITVVDCGPGKALRLRAAEENMNARYPFDRVDDAIEVIARYEQGARVFATFEQMGQELGEFSRDVTVTTLADEVCACAVFYPELRGDKPAFSLKG